MQAARPVDAAAVAGTDTAAKSPSAPAPATTLAYLPVGMFGSVMGLSGLALAWRAAHQVFGAPAWPSAVLGGLAILSFILLAIAYGIKAVSGFAAVRAEFNHPVAGNLFGTPLISLLLLPMLLTDISLTLARLTWVVGAFLMTLFAWTIVLRWLSVRHTNAQIAPPWIVPVVGMLDLPLAVPSLQWEGLHGVMLFGLSVGLFFALPLMSMLLARLALEEPLPAPLQPSLLILLAPFSVGFASYVTTVGHIDGFASGLVMVTLFLLPVLLGRLVHLPACSPFRVSWWAASFPLAASAGAAVRYAAYVADPVMDVIAMIVLAIATVAIAVFAVQTVVGIARGRLKELS